MSKRGLNIYKRKDGRWEGRYIKGCDKEGKTKYGYIYAKTYSEVKRRLLIHLNEHGKSKITSKGVLYEHILHLWLESIQIQVKESTFAHYSQLVNVHIIPKLGWYSIEKLDNRLIECKLDEMLTNGKINKSGGLSPKTVTDILSIIKASIEYANDNNYDIQCNLHRLSVKQNEKVMRVLNEKEQSALEAVLLNNTDLYKLGVLLCLYTGIRVGELCALKWKHIDLENDVLHIQNTMQRIRNLSDNSTYYTKIIITEPKSKCSIRDIPIINFLKQLLITRKALPDAFFLTGACDKYVEPRLMQYKFKKYIQESNIEDANFHSLRHTFATRCVENNFEIKSLSEILGHANVNITLNKYVHSSFELKKQNMNKLEKIRKI